MAEWEQRRTEKRISRIAEHEADRILGGGGSSGKRYKVAKVLSKDEATGTYTVRECDADGNEMGVNITGVKNLGPDIPEQGDKVVIVKDRDGDWCFQS